MLPGLEVALGVEAVLSDGLDLPVQVVHADDSGGQGRRARTADSAPRRHPDRRRHPRGVARHLLMTLSSRACGREVVLEAPSVTYQGPQDVHSSAGQRKNCLGVPLAFGTLALVVATGRVAVADADERGGVEDALQPAVITPGPVQVAADVAGVAGHRGDTREAGQAVGASVAAHVTGRGCQELGAQQRADAGHAGDHFGEFVLAKPGRDEFVDLGDLLVEAHHLLRQGVDHLSGDLLPGDGGVLALGCVQGIFGQGSALRTLRFLSHVSSRPRPVRRRAAGV